MLRCAALCLISVSQSAKADVIEIGADGAVAVRASDPGTVTPVSMADTPQDIENAPDVPLAALTGIEQPSAPAAYQASLARAADAAGVSPTLLAALVWQESRWRPGAVSPKGAQGLTQLMPETARALAVDSSDSAANLAGGARYLRHMLDLFGGNLERALAAYNAGPGRVMHATGLPAIPETRAYVVSIMDRLGGTAGSILGGVKP